MGATETVSKWIVTTTYEDIPPDAIRVANESCFDLLGVILAGSTEPVGEIIRQYVTDLGGNPEATVLASGQRSSQQNAALANGTMGHALDYDDFGGFGRGLVSDRLHDRQFGIKIPILAVLVELSRPILRR